MVQQQNAFSFRGTNPVDHELCPLTPLGALPPDPRIGSRSALAMSPTRVFCPPHYFRPGDAPGYVYTGLIANKCCIRSCKITHIVLNLIRSEFSTYKNCYIWFSCFCSFWTYVLELSTLIPEIIILATWAIPKTTEDDSYEISYEIVS